MKKIFQILPLLVAFQSFGQSTEYLPNGVSIKTPYNVYGLVHSNLDESNYFFTILGNTKVVLAANTAMHFAVNNGPPAVTFSASETLTTFNTYTKLGALAPAIKTKLLMGITAAGTGSDAGSEIVHGLNPAKILDIKLVVDLLGAGNVTEEYTRSAGYQTSISFNGAFIYVTNSILNSANIRSKPFKLYVTYEQ
jgi:hypothetical protein